MRLMDIAPYLLVGLIIFINIALWSMFKGKGTRQHMDLWRKAGSTLQKPWEKEDRSLQELSERVKHLQEKPNHPLLEDNSDESGMD